MKVLCHLHNYPPALCSGADRMAESLNNFLISKGCEVTVAIDNCDNDYVVNGVKVTSNKTLLGEKYESADVILTHFLFKGESAKIAARFKKPVFHVMHSFIGTELSPDMPDNYIIYNSNVLKEQIEPGFPMENIVVQPPTFLNDWQNDIDHFFQPFITLINTTPNKGGDMFFNLANNLGFRKFLGVRGGYGSQQLKNLSNITYKPFTNNPKQYYDLTTVIIVPSISESWSLVAAEAMAIGIPVVCSDLPGLRENCGDAAIYCKSLREFIDAIRFLEREDVYYEYVNKGLERMASKNHFQQLEKMFNFMAQKVKNRDEKVNITSSQTEKKEVANVKEKKEFKRPYSKFREK